MTEADPLELDTLSPVDDAIIVDRTDDMFIQHGGCATRVVFDEGEEMTDDQYLEDLQLLCQFMLRLRSQYMLLPYIHHHMVLIRILTHILLLILILLLLLIILL